MSLIRPQGNNQVRKTAQKSTIDYLEKKVEELEKELKEKNKEIKDLKENLGEFESEPLP